MKRLLLIGLLALIASCGDNIPGTTCGPGTKAVGDECVPDGSMICAQGTVFNPATSHCDVDPSACAAGTALVNGVCVPEDDAMAADLQEAAEPNDSTMAGQFDVPALDASITLHGCITPTGGAADIDPWLMTASGPMVVEITADGVHGLDGAFAVIDNSGNPLLDSWQRLGINFTGDTSKRQVYLPAAGEYVLLMDDTRHLFFNEGVGGTNTCYFGTVKHVATPAATALTFPDADGMDSGNVRVLSFDATGTGDIVDLTQDTASTSMVESFVVVRKGVFEGVATGDPANFVPAQWTSGGFDTTGDQLQIVVDNVYNYGLLPQAYTLTNYHVTAQPLPTAGTTITATEHNASATLPGYLTTNFFYFDVASAGQIVDFNLTSTTGIQFSITRHDIFTPAGALDSVMPATGTVTTFNGQFVRFKVPGRYYVRAIAPAGVDGTTYMVTSTLTNMTTTAATYGTPMATQALTPQGPTFYSLDVLNTYEWAELGVSTAANWGAAANARITLYDLAGEGLLGATTYPAVQTAVEPPDGSANAGRVVLNDTRDYLVRIEDTVAPGASPTFTLDLKERAHTNLGPASLTTPIMHTDTLAANTAKRFLVTGTAGYHVHALETPTIATVDVSIERRNVDETIPTGGTINTGGAGVAETLNATLGAAPNNYLAYTVTNRSATTATDVDQVISATVPQQYTVTAGALTYADICTGGTTIMTAQDDTLSAIQTLPAALNTFAIFGEPATSYKVSSNGFLTFVTSATSSAGGNVAMPATGAPNGIIAPYWEDLNNVTVCKFETGTTVTLQWTGYIYDDPTEVAEFQVVLHANGEVDFIYSANHTLAGDEIPDFGSNGATSGIESLDGGFATQVFFNTATVAPGSSQILAPN